MNGTQENKINIISSAIKQGRMRRGWSQKELASFMHVVPSLVSKWENGKAVPPGDSLFTMVVELNLVPLLFSEYLTDDSEEIKTLRKEIQQLKRDNIEMKRRLERIEDTVLIK